MSFYSQIRALGPPIDIGLDTAKKRASYSVNFMADVSSFSGNITGDILKLLAAQGIGEKGVNLFRTKIAPTANIADNVWFAIIIATGGMSPDETHNGDYLHHVGFQVFVRHIDPDVASNKAWEIYSFLDGIRGKEVEI